MDSTPLHLVCVALLAAAGCSAPAAAPRNTAQTAPRSAPRTSTEMPKESAAEGLALVRAKLASDEAATRAWGAWEAGEAGARELVPELVAALRRALENPGHETRTFELRAELDALVRLDARLSPEDLMGVSRIAPLTRAAMVLASREPRRHADALTVMRAESWSDDRHVIDDLLAAGAPERAVELLLPEFRMQLIVNVSAGDTGRGEGQRSVRIGCGRLRVPDGFPPVVLYQFVSADDPRSVRFTDGPRPFGYVREVRFESSIPISETVRGRDEAQHALEILLWIAGDDASQSVLASKVRIRHTWVDAPTYLQALEQALVPRERAWNALIGRLVEAGLLAPSRIPETAPIELVVEDDRAIGSAALPEWKR